MAQNTAPIFGLVPHTAGVQFANADGTTKKTLLTAGANGTKIDSISVCSDDTSTVDLAFSINDGTTDHYLGNVHVAIGAGYTTVAKVEGISALMPSYLTYLDLPATYTLKVNAVAAVTSAKVVDVIAIGRDY